MEALVFGLVVFWIASAFFCSWLAEVKGRDRTAWTILGLAFGLAALITIAGAPVENKRVGPARVCPLCDEIISARTTRCPRCTGEIPPVAATTPGPSRASTPQGVSEDRRSRVGVGFCTNFGEKLFAGETVCPKCKTAQASGY